MSEYSTTLDKIIAQYTDLEIEQICKALNKSYNIYDSEEHRWAQLQYVFFKTSEKDIRDLRKTQLSNRVVNDLILRFYPCERVVKYYLLKKLRLLTNHIVAFEMSIGNSRIDLCRINGKSYAYEIKTAYDTFERLETQMSDYLDTFEKVYLVIPFDRREDAAYHVPANCGIITYRIDVDGELHFHYFRKAIGFLGNFFAQMGSMGMELFDMPWVQSIMLFFSYLAWTLYAVGLVVSAFETGIAYQNGHANIKESLLDALKGFLAVGMFTTVPIALFKLSVRLQASLTNGIAGQDGAIGTLATGIISSLQAAGSLQGAAGAGIFGGLGAVTSPILLLFIIIMMGYSVIKVFFANLKRGGILLIQISVGSLYMVSVPRGYTDGFLQWCKQVIGLCLTTFLQATILVAGLMVLPSHCLLGLGLMLAAGEVPRICGAFGLDTSTRANVTSAFYTAQAAVNATRTMAQAVPK